MVCFKAVVKGHEISRLPFRSWNETVSAVERKGVKILRFWPDRTPEVDRQGIVIRVNFEVVRAA